MNKSSAWSRKANTLLYKGEDVGMIGYSKEKGEVVVDMMSYDHTYTSEDIKTLAEYLWFERILCRTSKN